VNFRVPSRPTQKVAPFLTPLCATDYSNNETITRYMRQDPTLPITPYKCNLVDKILVFNTLVDKTNQLRVLYSF